MSLQLRLGDLITAIGTDYKQFRTWITGSTTGDLTGLTTTDKSSLVAAVNEVKASSGSPAAASTTASGIAEIATLAEVATGTDTTRFVTAEGVRQERTALKAELLGGATAAFDTLNELAALVTAAEETSVIDALTTVVGGKADASTVYTQTQIGNPETDLAAAYTAAKV
jgi:hypothetical protein